MSTQDHASLIQRMIKRPHSGGRPLIGGPVNLFRRAVVKSAGELGLKPQIREVEQSELGLAGFLSSLDQPGWLLVVIDGPEGARGAMALNMSLVSALIEVQTLGRLSGATPGDRTLTRTDAAIAEPFISGVLTLFEGPSEPDAKTSFAFGAAVRDVHGLGIVLDDRKHSVFRACFDFEGGAAEAEVFLALPLKPDPSGSSEAVAEDGHWEPALTRNVQEASMNIDVVLHRMKLSLKEVQRLTEGQVFELPGHVLGKVSLEVGGTAYGDARLGQAGGMRAVKLNGADGGALPEMEDPEPPKGTQLLAE